MLAAFGTVQLIRICEYRYEGREGSMSYKCLFKAGLAMTCLSLPLLAPAAERLNVKLGLWEITTMMETGGVPPIPKEVLDKMTPEQRAKLLASLQSSGAQGPHKEVNRECITQKDLDRPFQMEGAEGCKATVVSATSTSQEINMVCNSAVKGSGVFKVSAPTPTTMSGIMNMKSGDATRTFTIKEQMSGHWLSADCGDEADDSDDPEAGNTPEE